MGRRTAKQYFGKVTRWIWDGNVPIHEWRYKTTEIQPDEKGESFQKEPIENITTWVFEEGTFVPTAKIQEGKQYSIVSDYLGTPIQMYDEQGNKTWDCTLDIYGKVLAIDKGTEFDCPFRYQGQYVDKETKLCYNRFRYYEPEIGNYISQDPIGLSAGERFYSYVKNVNLCIDIFGLVAKEFDIDTYGNISSRANIGDNLTAHELLQHAWLEQNNKLPTSKNRGVDLISKENPSIALREKGIHNRITALQNRYGMKGKNLKGQSALENINKNAALTRRGIMEGLIADGMDRKTAKEKATALVEKLRQDAIAHAKANNLITCKS